MTEETNTPLLLVAMFHNGTENEILLSLDSVKNVAKGLLIYDLYSSYGDFTKTQKIQEYCQKKKIMYLYMISIMLDTNKLNRILIMI